jgi:hypothetical protein
MQSKHRDGAALDSRDELSAGLDTLLFLILDPHSRFFYIRPRLFRRILCMVPFGTPWAKARSLQLACLSSFMSAVTAAAIDISGPLGFLGAQVLLVVGVFPSFELLNDVID